MQIDEQRYVNIHATVVGIAAVDYLVSVFVTKSLSLGLVAVLSAALYNLLRIKDYRGRLKAAAVNWLIPVAVGIAASGRFLDTSRGALRLINLGLVLVFSAVPMILLYTGTATKPARKRGTIAIVQVRMVVQVIVFALYLALSAATWVRGSTIELVFWWS